MPALQNLVDVRMEIIMHYSAGVASLAAFGADVALPQEGVLWFAARLMLDCAGGLFAIYLLAGIVLSLTGGVMRARSNSADPGWRREK